ncbi:hypothetical protein RXV95_14985 [Novosphingobium sp. ZN18A2]|uniref:hypothetical protein n=1 Tax=Novosphingobium sp. ZN18A2 TaxID=3079861 RepID=UPI0030D47764
MLFHVSIDAHDPQRVATVLAELFGGAATPFPPVIEGSWVAHAGDDRNTLVEVYPRNTELVEAEGDADGFGMPGAVRGGSSTHFAMATPLDEDEVHAIARREGWTSKYRKRGGAFGVIEVWIEGDRMIEVLTHDMQREYLDAMRLPVWQAMLAQGAPA